ncbi:hypothetical protein EDD11_003559 [Mortierella claussenii]|nr:hypothetical protein EDD11_003559 [Mortierella claussenii]
MDADQKTLFYFAIFDGHGGSHTADYLTAHLDEYIEQAQPSEVPTVIRDLRRLGGYFRSFRPHFLEPFLPPDFEDKYGGKHSGGGGGGSAAAERARQQRKVHIKGRGGQVKPMIFIPHPNATEEEQEQEMKTLETQAEAAQELMDELKEGDQNPKQPGGMSSSQVEKPELEPETEQEKRLKKGLASAGQQKQDMEKGKEEEEKEEEEEEYDEDEDPLEITRRRNLNKTSPLPGATSSYSGGNRSEYEKIVIRDQQQANKNSSHSSSSLSDTSPWPMPTSMTLEQRLCLSFLQCDTELIRDKYGDGSTASVVIVQSKGAFWETQDDLDLILAHVGDTRVLLCEAPRGESIQLTTDHHPDAIVEGDRIRKMAAYVSADSFGENMFLGQLANTRALGDIAMKPFGVSAEPELIRRTVKASEAAFLVLISDGISSVMSNQEVVDCVKLEDNPTLAAANVLNIAEQLGAEDNCTVLVVKLPAWGKEMPDLSKELREYRWQSEAQHSRARRR